MKNDFIKWMCEKTTDFHFIPGSGAGGWMCDSILFITHQYLIKEKKFQEVLYPLLMQRTIDTIDDTMNLFCAFTKRHNGKYDYHIKRRIEQGSGHWESVECSRSIYETRDQAREECLIDIRSIETREG